MLLLTAGSRNAGRGSGACFQLILIAVATCAVVFAAGGSWAAQSCDDCGQCMQNCVCQADGTCDGTPKANTAQCDDGDPCTTGDHCDGAGSCVATGKAPSTTSCNDYNDCTTGDHCDGAGNCIHTGTKGLTTECALPGSSLCKGTCQGYGSYVVCVPNCGFDFCHQCDPSTGQCTLNACNLIPCSVGQCDSSGECIPANDGTSCDDGNVCTSNDTCQAGECAGTAGGTPQPTRTPTPTATPILTNCVGDCNDNDMVTVDEILTGVNIALGNLDVSLCENFDANGDGQVTVDEILTAVNAALNGCPQVAPSATPAALTATPTKTPTSPGGTPPPTGGSAPSIAARASGTIESTTSALLVIPNLIAAITRGLSGGGLGGSASLIPPIQFNCDNGTGSVSCDQSLFPAITPPTYALAFSNCQLSGSSGTLTINGTLTVADQQAEICFTGPPTGVTVTAQNLTIQMPTGTTAAFSSFSASVGLSCSGGSCSCLADTVTLAPTGTIAVTGTPSSQVTFGSGSSITVNIYTSNAQCVPTEYDMEVDGDVTLTTNGNTFAATYQAYDIYDNATSGQDMVDVEGDVYSTCFGDTVNFSTYTDIALGNPCPSDGAVDVYAYTSGDTDEITYSSSGVHIDFQDGSSADFQSCLDSQLFACPAS